MIKINIFWCCQITSVVDEIKARYLVIDGHSTTCEIIFVKNKICVGNGILYWYGNFIDRLMENKNLWLRIYNFYTVQNYTRLYTIIYKLQL